MNLTTHSKAIQLSQARKAEALTLDFERARLKGLNIRREPEWIGLDDCLAGYDVLSYDIGEIAPVNRMIAVTFAIPSPLRFIVTRNKWEQALRAGAAYVFHVWDMQNPTPVLYEMTIARLAAYVPGDNGEGRWLTAEILLDK